MSLDVKKTDRKEEKPYDTTYLKDYSVDAKPNLLTSILRTAPATKKTSEPKRNKSVKFSESVTISNGYQTLSGFMNDVERDYNKPQQSLTTTTPKNESQLTPPNVQRQSMLQTTPLLFPGQLHGNAWQSRPRSTGVFVAFRNDLRQLQRNYSKSATHRRIRREFPETPPDIRRVPDTRITINERRHVIPEIGCPSYYFHG